MEGSSKNGSGGVNGSMNSGTMSRAERFEDEKKRIIGSCFEKKDEDGSLVESYITHIRIVEDAAYPSSPPPPNANPDAKKPRLIIVAVRKSGRVRMHKARENVNGTFSIGKTWALDDLSAVQSYNSLTPSNAEEEQHQKWAGGLGFTVTIGKPYYWQANSAKERQFFIASLVKIYTKYTGGKSPELIGFDPSERDSLLGVSFNARPPPSQPPPPYSPSASMPSTPSMPPTPGQIQYGQDQKRAPPRRQPSEDPSLRSQSSRDAVQRPLVPPPTASFTSQTSRPSLRNQGRDSPSGSIDSNNAGNQAPPSLRRLAGSNQSQESFARSDDGYSQPPRSRGGMNGAQNVPGRFQDRSVTSNSQRVVTPEGSISSLRESDNVPPVPAPLALPPERRRPPMPNIGDSRRGQNSNENIVPAPLSSAGSRKEDIRPPTRNSERTQPREREVDVRNGSLSVPSALNGSTKTDATQREIVDTPPPLTPPSPSLAPAPAVQLPEEPEEEVRPGLGPMIKSKKSKGDIANSILRAAKAANAFKPRAGGAAQRLREKVESPEGPDGITGVVPAPSLLRGMSSDSSNIPTPASMPPQTSVLPDKPSTPKPAGESIPEVKITVPDAARPGSAEGPTSTLQDTIQPEKAKAREVKRIKSPAETMSKELATLGIDPNILGGRGGELVAAWEEFGWVGEGIRTKNIDQMKDEMDRELNKIQAGGWLSRINEEDERIGQIKQGLDKTMDECDELDGLLTLYLVELGTLTEDIAYIEAQSQGLQVQTSNQKLLQAELQSLLSTISISSDQLQSLREASLESPRGLEQIETALVMLFKAMLTIDPSLGVSGPRRSEDGSLNSGKPGGYGNSEIGSMRVLQEKKDVYRDEIAMFIRRLKPFLQVKFGAAVDETRKALERERGSNLTRAAGRVKLDPRNHDLCRDVLWRYSPLMLFSREVDRLEWEELMKMYEGVTRPLYQDEFRDAVFAWKRIGRKPTGDEGEILFTSQVEKQTEGIATTARKLTVKRSQTLAKSLRSPIGDNGSKTNIDKSDGRLPPHEVFSGVLEEVIPIMSMEQNFIVEFFHVSSLEQHDFSDAVSQAPPDSRRGGDLRRPRVMDPNRDLAKTVVQSMEEVYSFFTGDLQALMDWALQADSLQGVGILSSIERSLLTLSESSQEFLTRTLQKLHTRLLGLFNKFLDDQIRAIEDTKVKINKRKGVIGFIRIFPSFSLALETMLSTSHDLEIRETVNSAYARINKAMFESLKVIARENPSAHVAGADPEDKEALNYQILLIENMNHYLEEVDTRSNPVLDDWKTNAQQEMNEHMTLYLGAVIRRPLGKLLDFLESTESLMLSRQPGDSLGKISNMPSHSKSTFRKVLANYDSKEIRRGIEALRKRVEKHFGGEEGAAGGEALVKKVLSACEGFYEQVGERILVVSRDVYDGEVVAEWGRKDVEGAFRK